MNISEVMSTNVHIAPATTSIREAAQVMRDDDMGAIVVGSEGNGVEGIVTDRDITCRAVVDGLDVDETEIAKVMTSGIETCLETDDTSDVAMKMAAMKLHRLLVTDRDRRMVGIVSLGDIASKGPSKQVGDVGKALHAITK